MKYCELKKNQFLEINGQDLGDYNLKSYHKLYDYCEKTKKMVFFGRHVKKKELTFEQVFKEMSELGLE